MTGRPDGIMLPKALGGTDVSLLAARLSLREALHGIVDGDTKIIALATESAAAIFSLGTYKGASARFAGLTWGAEDLAADTGAIATRIDGGWTEPVRIVRSLALFGAAAAGVPAIDTVYTDFHDLDGLTQESAAAARDGFSGKLAIHPDQVAVINDAFTPTPEAIARAERIVAAFAEAGAAGVIALDGKMLDRPHLTAAERLLKRVAALAAKSSPSAPILL
jgi:citrate lyase subunit beta/citryl-CoA lyase